MAQNNYKQLYAIKRANEERIKKLCKNIDNRSGLYVFERKDENGILYAYIGQAKMLLERTASHLSGYQHIDISLKKWKLYDKEKNPNGWNLKIAEFCTESQLDEREQYWIMEYAKTHQLRNHNTGGNKGKETITDEPRKGFLQGKHEGKNQAYKEIGEIISKYGELTPKQGKIAERKIAELLEKFKGAEE